MHLGRRETSHTFLLKKNMIHFRLNTDYLLGPSDVSRSWASPGIFVFFDLLTTLKGCNFFSTEQILKISDLFLRRESNSFISAVLVAQSKIGVPSHGYLWAIISKFLKKIHVHHPIIVDTRY